MSPARPGTVARLNNPEEYTTMRTTNIDKKEEEETMKKYFIQFESGEGRDVSGAVNYLVCLDHPDLYAEIAVPDGASDDYGYLALKDQIIDQATAAGIDRSALEFWYDGQEDKLAPDASAGRAPRRMTVDDFARYYVAHSPDYPDVAKLTPAQAMRIVNHDFGPDAIGTDFTPEALLDRWNYYADHPEELFDD